jgi:hypothetical protein
MDRKLRELTYRLIAMAPEAPPFPEEAMVQLKPSPVPAPPPARRRNPLVWVGAAAVIALLVVGVPMMLFGGGDEPGPTTVPPATQTSVPDDVTPTTAPPGDVTTLQFSAYLFSDEVRTSIGDGALVPVPRAGTIVSDAVEERVMLALDSLVTDPVPAGFSSAIPGGIDRLEVGFQEGIVTFGIQYGFDAGGGTASMAARLAQLVFTATQFPEVEGVVLTDDGEIVDVFSSEGIVIDGPLTREGSYDDAQAIYVETPTYGSTVASRFRISGVANVFEATLQYEIVTASGDVLAAGFTTATCGTGCWGDFEISGTYNLAADTDGFVNVFVFSPRDGARENVMSYPVTLLASETTEPTTPPATTTPPTLPPGERSFDVDVTAIAATPVTGTVVVDAGWGSGDGAFGLDRSFGPCCFDVTGDGTVVVADTYNGRVVAYSPAGASRVLATFDLADFVPDGIATDGVSVFVVGLTNRPGRPYDLIVLDLVSGAQLARAETSLGINTDLRSTDFGDVYAGVAGARFTWHRLTANGVPLEPDSAESFGYLPGETSISVAYDAGAEIVVLPAGDSPTTTFDLPTDQFVFDVMTYRGAPDANGVLVALTPSIGGGEPMTLLFLGSRDGELVTDAVSIELPREIELGTFNTTRYGFGSVYVMTTTIDGLQIVRYELP